MASNNAGLRVAPAIPEDIVHVEARMQASDGLALLVQSWKPKGETKATLVIVHGLKDYSDRYAELAFAAARRGYAVHAFDLRGHGDSEGDRVWVDRFDDYLGDLGTFLKAPLLGKVTANVEIDGSGLTLEDVEAKLNGTINSIDFNDYHYNNVAIEGDVAKQVFNGKLNVKDDNIDFDFNGKVNYSQAIPEFRFIAAINKANLSVLNFITTSPFPIALVFIFTGN